MLVQKILELKDDQAKAFNEANKIYMEAQRIKGGVRLKSITSISSRMDLRRQAMRRKRTK